MGLVPTRNNRKRTLLYATTTHNQKKTSSTTFNEVQDVTRAVKTATRTPGKAKSTLSTPRYPTSHSNQKPGVGSFDASRRVGLGLRWTLNKNNLFLNYGRYCEQQQQQQRQLEACSRFKFDRHQTAIGWIVSPRSPLVDGTCS